jgi:hypothetical protein
MLRDNIPLQQKHNATETLKQILETIIQIGEATQVSPMANSRYVNLIFDLSHLIEELKYADRN